MKSIRTLFLLPVSLACMAACVGADFRPWTDEKGHTIEAEYIRTADNAVVLRKRDGTEIKVPLGTLCAEDRTYAMLQCPPKIEIRVNDRFDRDTLGYLGGQAGFRHIRKESVTADVSLRKTSFAIYDAELTVEMFLIGWMEQVNRYVIIQQVQSTFRFTDENKELFTCTYGPFDLQSMTGSIRSGAEYEGYLLVVRDTLNQIVATKASRLDFEKNAPAILKADKGAVFDEDFNFVRAGRESPGHPGDARRLP
jgi:hypothetical protein